MCKYILLHLVLTLDHKFSRELLACPVSLFVSYSQVFFWRMDTHTHTHCSCMHPHVHMPTCAHTHTDTDTTNA